MKNMSLCSSSAFGIAGVRKSHQTLAYGDRRACEKRFIRKHYAGLTPGNFDVSTGSIWRIGLDRLLLSASSATFAASFPASVMRDVSMRKQRPFKHTAANRLGTFMMWICKESLDTSLQ